MKSALVRTTFEMDNAWSETDTAETGREPRKGVFAFLDGNGLGDELAALAERFGMRLRSWRVVVHEQGETVSQAAIDLANEEYGKSYRAQEA